MAVWDKLIGEYATTGRVHACPACGAGEVLHTAGTICGEHGDVDISCPRCGSRWHYDGYASMHDWADPATIRRRNEKSDGDSPLFHVEYIGEHPSSRFIKGEIYEAMLSCVSSLIPSYCIWSANGRRIVAAAALFRRLEE